MQFLTIQEVMACWYGHSGYFTLDLNKVLTEIFKKEIIVCVVSKSRLFPRVTIFYVAETHDYTFNSCTDSCEDTKLVNCESNFGIVSSIPTCLPWVSLLNSVVRIRMFL